MDAANTRHITEALLHLFRDEGQRIVFWNDPEGEFADTLKELDLGDVKILHLDEHSPLELKILLEIQDKTGAYLLYDPNPELSPEDDWLLDIRLYSRTFYADRASIILNELGLESESLRLFLVSAKNSSEAVSGSKDSRNGSCPETRKKSLILRCWPWLPDLGSLTSIRS